MLYKVYQVHPTEQQRAELNGMAKTRFVDAFFGMGFGQKRDIMFLMYAGHYQLSAKIEAEDLEDVFAVGNRGKFRPSQSLERIGRFKSISVGDVIVDEEGWAHYVDNFGFGEIINTSLVEKLVA